jgi:hypothetical protein
MDGYLKQRCLSMKPKPVSIPEINSSPFFLPAEVCSLLRCSKRTLIRYYKGYVNVDGRRVRPVLGSVRRGGRILFAKTEIDRFLAARTQVAA